MRIMPDYSYPFRLNVRNIPKEKTLEALWTDDHPFLKHSFM